MRYININKLLKKRYRWGKRKELWKNRILQKDFRDFSYNKCWYTEIQLIGQDAPIDHFRPKGAIKPYKEYKYNEPLKDTGYAWLKNEPSNYRLCCTYANRVTGVGGKSCYFPLSNESEYLTEGGSEREVPLLIDPCNRNDVQLISFMGNQVVSTSKEEYCKKRIEVSASIYNMNDPYIKTQRAKVWDNVEKILAEYQANNINEAACLRWLSDAIDRSAQFSACAIACVNSLAPDEIKAKLDLIL